MVVGLERTIIRRECPVSYFWNENMKRYFFQQVVWILLDAISVGHMIPLLHRCHPWDPPDTILVWCPTFKLKHDSIFRINLYPQKNQQVVWILSDAIIVGYTIPLLHRWHQCDEIHQWIKIEIILNSKQWNNTRLKSYFEKKYIIRRWVCLESYF